MRKLQGWVFVLVWFLMACSERVNDNAILPATEQDRVLEQVTEMMVHDVNNPPLAMRFYAYVCLAGYETLSAGQDSLPRVQDFLNEYTRPLKTDTANVNRHLASLLAMAETSAALQPSGALMKTWKSRYLDSCRNAGWSKESLERADSLALQVSKHVVAYARKDGYAKLSALPKYRPTGKHGNWYPTPPGYFPAVEPHFFRIRPFLLDSSHLEVFAMKAPTPFDSTKDSPFYRTALEVYEEQKNEHGKVIAAFWDCNPFALSENGHLMIGLKKISPGAHWMGIASIASRKAGLDFERSLMMRMVLSINMLDGFWLCWKEKYRTDRVRPETAIRKWIDPSWKPFLQTPPFPEYPSGHSVVSSAAAVVLTHFLGNDFSYTDTVERRYGIPDRSFTSFAQAAEEASLSRFYGGIHFMDAIVNGQALGNSIATSGLKKLGLVH